MVRISCTCKNSRVGITHISSQVSGSVVGLFQDGGGTCIFQEGANTDPGRGNPVMVKLALYHTTCMVYHELCMFTSYVNNNPSKQLVCSMCVVTPS